MRMMVVPTISALINLAFRLNNTYKTTVLRESPSHSETIPAKRQSRSAQRYWYCWR